MHSFAERVLCKAPSRRRPLIINADFGPLGRQTILAAGGRRDRGRIWERKKLIHSGERPSQITTFGGFEKMLDTVL